MALVAIVLVLAAVVGIAAGGRPRALAHVPLSGWQPLFGAGACQLAAVTVSHVTGSDLAYEVGSVAAFVLLITFLLSNVTLSGIPLIMVGLLLNALTIGTNGAMPVSRAAAARAGVNLTDIAAGLDARHVVSTTGMSLRLLGDVVPLPVPWMPEVVSPGDVLVAAGLALLLVLGLLGRVPGQAGRWRPGTGTGRAATGTPEDAVRDTTLASASTTRGSYS